MDDQVLDLVLMTNYTQSIFMWTVVVSICIDPILSGLVIQQNIASNNGLTILSRCCEKHVCINSNEKLQII